MLGKTLYLLYVMSKTCNSATNGQKTDLEDVFRMAALGEFYLWRMAGDFKRPPGSPSRPTGDFDSHWL